MYSKFRFSNARARDGVMYNIAKNTLAAPILHNLIQSDSYPVWQQLDDSVLLSDRNRSRKDTRFYLSLILSHAPSDMPSESDDRELASYVIDRYFREYPSITVFHKDKGADKEKEHPLDHMHMIIGTRSVIDGHALHLSIRDMRAIQDGIDEFCRRKGWAVIDRSDERPRRERQRSRYTVKGESWVRKIHGIVFSEYTKATSLDDLIARISRRGVTVTERNELRFSISGSRDHWITGPSLDKRLRKSALISHFASIGKEAPRAIAEPEETKQNPSVQPQSSKPRTAAVGATSNTSNQKMRFTFTCAICPSPYAEQEGRCALCTRYSKTKQRGGRSR